MQLTETRKGKVVALGASGRIDHETAEGFQKALEPHLAACAEGGDAVILDMAKVDYVSSVGLRVLLMASKRASAQNGRLVVAAMQPTVGEVFRISQFDRIMASYDSVDAAVTALNA